MEPTPDQLKAMQAADAARMVLDNPLVVDALDTIEREVVGLLVDLPLEKREQAEECRRLLHSMKQFKRLFEVLVNGGEITRNELLNAHHMQQRIEAQRQRIYG